MKKIMSLSAFVALMLIISSCSTQGAGLSQSLQRKWMMISFKTYKKDDLVKAKANVDLSATKTNPNQYSAFMGCNRMFFSANFKADGKVKFSKVGSTMMYCDKMMNLEAQFAKALPQMTRYSIKGHFLTLSAQNGDTMSFVAEDWD